MPSKSLNIQRNRKMQKSGAITIPSDIRTRYGFKKGGQIEMTVLEDGSIRIVPKYPVCAICQKREAQKKVRNVPICQICAGEAVSVYE